MGCPFFSFLKIPCKRAVVSVCQRVPGGKIHPTPSFEFCEEKNLTELLENSDLSTVFVINPATECEFVKSSYYTACLKLAENIDEKRIREILKKRKSKVGRV